MSTRRILGGLFAAALAMGVVVPVAQAAEPAPMDAQTLQQMVLRAQFPRTLGGWEQYLYGTTRNEAPTVCWGARGAVQLPKAPIEGYVNYQVNENTNGSVSVYQYANSAEAGLRDGHDHPHGECTARPKFPTESETFVTADQGYDQTDAAFTGLGSALTVVDPANVRGYISTMSTQRGLAVVQTQVRQYVPLPQTVGQQQRGLDRVDSVNEAWHARVLAAYQAFGVEGTAR